MSDDIKENISDTGIWLRALFMLLFAGIFCIIRLLLGAVIVGQFLWVLFTRRRNVQLLGLANQLAAYLYQIYRYLSFNTETRPFPFEAFPTTATLIPGDEEIAEETDEAELTDDQQADEPIADSSNESATESDESVDAASESNIENEDKKS